MKANVFRSHVEVYNKKWLCNALNMASVQDRGIDLLDSDVGLEMKCRYDKYATNFAIHAYQVKSFAEIHHDKTLYWAFLIYSADKTVSSIKRKDDLSKILYNVRVTIIEWDWVKQFPISDAKTGPYIYVHSKDFPSEEYFNIHNRNGGRLLIPKNSILEEKVNSTNIKPVELDTPF